MPDMDKKNDELAVVATTNDSHQNNNDIVSKSNNNNNHTHSSSRRVKEKVVYKVVPVPYYYPIPVDAEWYYKHYEPPTSRNGGDRTPCHAGVGEYPEDAASLEGFPFPPPPAYGMTPPRSALREPYYYSSTRDEDERFVRPVSPLFRHVSPSGSGNGQYSPSMTAPHKVPKESNTNGLNNDSSKKNKQKSEGVKNGEDGDTESGEQQQDSKKGDAVEDQDNQNHNDQSISNSPDYISPRVASIKSERLNGKEMEDRDGEDQDEKNKEHNDEDNHHQLGNKDDISSSCGGVSSDNNSKSDIDDEHDAKDIGEDDEKARSNSITNSGGDSEVFRKRRRFPMTFPYDQRKKILKENGQHSPTQLHHHQHYLHHHHRNGDSVKHHRNGYMSEGEGDYKRSRSSEDPEARIYSSHKYSSANGGGSITNGHYPYVMVPVRSPPYGDVGRPPRYSEHSHSSYYESRMYDDSYSPQEAMGRNKDDVSDDKREIRYHPNGRRARTVFTRQQLLTLNNVFEKHPFVSGERMSELSDQLGLDRKIVKIWFQNKRQYARKKGSLVERGNEEFYYEYQDRYNPSSAAPPTMAEQWKAEK